MEFMSNVLYLLLGVCKGYCLGYVMVLDVNIYDGLWCFINDEGMGLIGEWVVEKYSIGCEEQDVYVIGSYCKVVVVVQGGLFKDEIVLVMIKGCKGDVIVDIDEGFCVDISEEMFGKLKFVFKKDGLVMVGNVFGFNDGVVLLLVVSEELVQVYELMLLVEIVDYVLGGFVLEWVMMMLVLVIQKLLKKMNIQVGDVDFWELNEVFSVQSFVVVCELGLDVECVNVNGGVVVLGYFIGVSGVCILVMLFFVFKQQDKEFGVVILCMGGGNGLVLVVCCFG